MTSITTFAIISLMLDFASFAQTAGRLLDAIGVIVILGGVSFATLAALITIVSRQGVHHTYRSYRQNMARSILIGLEFLVAGDIIRSVAGNLNLDSVLILAIIVVIRSFLGMEFEMEIEGHWPWRRTKRTRKRVE
ncbi:conserved hypothetical protein [candidate division TM7 genomosp. GTL1]|nr:conserved hypothetical protein [candidate division TM7 genomosp. GTL1]